MICELTSRQKWLYRAIRNKISIEDLVQTSTATSASSSATNNLMNIVMQFRKVRWGARVWLRCIAEIWVGFTGCRNMGWVKQSPPILRQDDASVLLIPVETLKFA